MAFDQTTHATAPSHLPSRSSRRQTAGQRRYRHCYIQAEANFVSDPPRMNDALTIECPHCGESFSLALDASEGSGSFTVDCEICCRPMTVTVRINDDGGIEGLDVAQE